MYMTLTGSDKDKVGRICQILPKVASEEPQSASKWLKPPQKVPQTGPNRPICKNLQKGGEMRT